nr:hypothetical protein [Tanacetum cinerariifolium]
MVAILEKGEYNTDFYPMVDFIAASPLRYALTVKPTIFVSYIRKFWSTARIETTEEGTHILATVDVHQGEGSGIPTEPLHTPSPEADPSYHTTSLMPLPSIPTALISPVTQTETTPIRQYTRRARIAQSSALPTIADELASLVRDVNKGEACPTDSGFIADQDRATIAKSSSLPHDSAPKVTSPVVAEGSMQPNITELMVLCTSLQRRYSELLAKFQDQEVEIRKLKDRVKVLEDREGVAATQSGDDAPIKRRSIDEGKASTERINDDSEELARVLTSMDVATVLAGGIDVPTSSGFIPTAGPHVGDIPTGSDDVPTASLVFATATVVTLYSRRKGKEVMVESDTPKKQRFQEQIDAQGMIDSLDRTNETIAKYIQEYQEFASELPLERRIELISDLVKYQDNYAKTYKFQSQQRKPRTKKQKKDFYMAVIRSNLGWKVKDFKGMTFEEIEAKFNMIWKQVEDFIPMGSKEEAERYKRKGIRFDQESSKKLKSSEEVIKDVKSTEEIPKEKMKEMMQLVPIKEVYVQALQVKHPIIDCKVYTEGQRSYWKIIRLGGSSACYQFFIDLLKQLDREDLNQLWALVKEYLSIRPATSEKEMEL